MNSKGKNQVKEVAGAKGAARTVPGLWQALSKRWLRGRGTDSGLTPRGEREAGGHKSKEPGSEEIPIIRTCSAVGAAPCPPLQCCH